jgi:hypothetical protein
MLGMLHLEKGFVPLSQIDGREITLGKGLRERSFTIVSNIPDFEIEPGVDIKDKIGIKPKNIFRLMKAGAIRKLTLLGSEGKSSQYTPEVAGSPGTDSSAVAGLKITEEIAPSSNIHSIGDETLFRPLYDSTVEVNLTKISDMLSQKGELRSPRGWAKEFNQAVKKGVRRVAIKNVLPHDWVDALSKTFVDTLYLAGPSLVGLTGIEGSNIVKAYAIVYSFMNLSTSFGLWMADRALTNPDAERPRFSLLPGNQLERVGIIYDRSKMTKVAKAL